MVASLVVLHLDGVLATCGRRDPASPAGGETRAIAALPRSNLAAIVDVMQS